MARIEHFHFYCADPQVTFDFFARYFGAVEESRVKLPDWLIVRAKLGETIVAFSPKRGDMVLGDAARGPRRGFDHIGISVERIDELVARMRADGVEIASAPYDAGPVRIAYVYAPDGIQLELLEPRKA
jgi:catechol 2,3-dioxygenase-like lactoylglutathione lyase family enzyme